MPTLWNFEHSSYPFNNSRGSLTTIPLWPILLLVNIPAALITHRFLCTQRRLRAHACLSCGYHLANLPSSTCPECGKRSCLGTTVAKPSLTPPPHNPAPLPQRLANRHARLAIIALPLAVLASAVYAHSFVVTLKAPLTQNYSYSRWLTLEAGVLTYFTYEERELMMRQTGLTARGGMQFELINRPDHIDLRLRQFSLPSHWLFEYRPPQPGWSRSDFVIPLWPFLLLANISAALFLRTHLRTHRRLRSHACLSCGYKLANLPSPTCPECGNKP